MKFVCKYYNAFDFGKNHIVFCRYYFDFGKSLKYKSQ